MVEAILVRHTGTYTQRDNTITSTKAGVKWDLKPIFLPGSTDVYESPDNIFPSLLLYD